jgi:dephospho-CoA kinase
VLKIGLTGGIASGKSLVASRLRELGAVVIDADALAREVVAPGTKGLVRVVDAFGPGILGEEGQLDRARLAAVVFRDAQRMAVLNGIVHPLVREQAAAIASGAPRGSIVVQDIPLLVESAQGAAFHLVVVVDAPDDVRVRRMLDNRHMTEPEALARMAAQAPREVRLAAADVVLDNSGTPGSLLQQVDRLWQDRLVPYAANLEHGLRAPRAGGPVLLPHDPDWSRQASLLMDRIKAAAPEDILAVDHIGSTAIPGLEAKDVIDLQLAVKDLGTADRISPLLAAAGFPAFPDVLADHPRPSSPHPSGWRKRLHGNADPGRDVNLHIRAVGSPGWRYALCFRDWLTADAAALEAYRAEKRRVAALHANDSSTIGYAVDKEAWFTEVAEPGMEQWVKRTGWSPPSYAASVGNAQIADSACPGRHFPCRWPAVD